MPYRAPDNPSPENGCEKSPAPITPAGKFIAIARYALTRKLIAIRSAIAVNALPIVLGFMAGLLFVLVSAETALWVLS